MTRDLYQKTAMSRFDLQRQGGSDGFVHGSRLRVMSTSVMNLHSNFPCSFKRNNPQSSKPQALISWNRVWKRVLILTYYSRQSSR
jgi:hypothetical protein